VGGAGAAGDSQRSSSVEAEKEGGKRDTRRRFSLRRKTSTAPAVVGVPSIDPGVLERMLDEANREAQGILRKAYDNRAELIQKAREEAERDADAFRKEQEAEHQALMKECKDHLSSEHDRLKGEEEEQRKRIEKEVGPRTEEAVAWCIDRVLSVDFEIDSSALLALPQPGLSLWRHGTSRKPLTGISVGTQTSSNATDFFRRNFAWGVGPSKGQPNASSQSEFAPSPSPWNFGGDSPLSVNGLPPAGASSGFLPSLAEHARGAEGDSDATRKVLRMGGLPQAQPIRARSGPMMTDIDLRKYVPGMMGGGAPGVPSLGGVGGGMGGPGGLKEKMPNPIYRRTTTAHNSEDDVTPPESEPSSLQLNGVTN